MSIVNSPTPTTGSGRGSYPSRQKRFGPAPLASFEDLPTDDQQSSSEDERRGTISPSKICPPISVVITEYNGPEQYDMYNGSPNVTPTNCTVTVDHTEKISTKNVDIGFANNTIAPKVTEKRKGSWTDLFSIRKSPTPPKERERKFSLFNFKFFSKDNRTSSESQLKEISNIDSIERKQSKIVVQDKCETTPQTIDVDDGRQSSCTLGDESISSYCSDITPTNMETKSFISVTETVVEIERPYSANDVINVVNQITNDSDSPSLCSLNDQDQTDCCYETETDCAECKATETIKITCECVDTDCCNGSAEDNEDESVEHVLASEDCELEYLLTGDELEHNLNANLDISSYKPNQTISNVTNKINLKVSMPEMLKTSSIERPHSITPVNIDSFEAYLNQSLTPESKPNYDRLTITIPGLPSPSQHNRFARKSNPFIWAEFCERGLKSPQIIRKRANSCFPEINCQHSYVNDAFELSVGSPENLTPITPIKDMDDGEDRFDDNFWDYLNRVNRPNVTKSTESDSVADDVPIRVAVKNLRRLQTSCSCDCNTTSVGSANAYHGVSITSCSEMNSFSESDNNEPSMSSAMNHQPFQSKLNEDEPLVSPCDCTCHGRRPEAIPFSLTDISTSIESTHSCLCNQSGELLYDGRTTEDDDLSQLSSSSTLSSSSSTPSSTSQSVRLLDTSATSNKTMEDEQEIDLDQITDENLLQSLLDQTDDPEDRKVIRDRIKELRSHKKNERDEKLAKLTNTREDMLQAKKKEAEQHKQRTMAMYDNMAKSAPAGDQKKLDANILKAESMNQTSNSTTTSKPLSEYKIVGNLPTTIGPKVDLVEDAIKKRQREAEERKRRIMAAFDVAAKSTPAGAPKDVDFDVTKNVDITEYEMTKAQTSGATFQMSGGVPVVKRTTSIPGTPTREGKPQYPDESNMDVMERSLRERQRECEERKKKILEHYSQVSKQQAGPKVFV